MEKNEDIMEHLRATLLKDIELQEEVRERQEGIMKTQKKMFTRVSMIYIGMFCIVAIMLTCTIYIVMQSASKSEVALKQLEILRAERADAAGARNQFLEAIEKNQSVIQKSDSVVKSLELLLDKKLDLEYKKLMR